MKTHSLNFSLVTQFYKEPEKLVNHFDLVYANDSMLSIQRSGKKKNFVYSNDGKRIKTKKTLQRIRDLVIPPAWTDVKIAAQANAHIQAVGRDSKGRKQYRYHSKWNTIRNRTKFFKMHAYGEKLPQIRERVDLDLKSKDWSKTKVLALVVRLLEETHIRIGNSYYAKTNETYGLSTLRSKHVEIFNNRLKFEFVGKRGKHHSITVRNKKLINLVQQCEEIPGWELFKFYEKGGTKHSIDSTMVNDYIHKISGDIFTAKDFRTWGASKIYFDSLKSFGLELQGDNAKKNILSAIDVTSKALGNTRNVVKKYYVHPAITKSYLNGSIEPYFNDDFEIMHKRLTSSENAMLQVMANYKPKFN